MGASLALLEDFALPCFAGLAEDESDLVLADGFLEAGCLVCLAEGLDGPGWGDAFASRRGVAAGETISESEGLVADRVDSQR